MKAPSGKSYVINGYVNNQNLIERVETWVGENIMGDMHVVATYSGWKDFGGVMAPTKIVQTRGGWPFFEVDVTAAQGESVRPRDARASTGAASGRPGWRSGPRRRSARAQRHDREARRRLLPAHDGRGQLRLALVEFKDYVMMLEAGQSQARALAYVAETKKLFPTKPIQYVMITHPHSDHTGGLPALVAEGATIITQKNNEEFLDRALNTPRTLLEDTLSKNPKKAKIETVVGEEGLLRTAREPSRCITSIPRRTRTA